MRKTRIGLMGFGEVGRHIYRLLLNSDDCEIVAISDIAQPEILQYLLNSESKGAEDVYLDGKHFVAGENRARFFQIEKPQNMPWDLFGVDFVIDSTGKNMDRNSLQTHLDAGASRVILTRLPQGDIDRVLIMGVNDQDVRVSDRIISAGSGTTNAAGITIKILDDAFGVDYAIFTTIHAYTGDQPLRDVASSNPRRSRSAVENIIPNQNSSPEWLQKLLPEFEGRIEGSALNIPVPAGSLLDITTVMKREGVTAEEVRTAVEKAAAAMPEVIEVTDDPIVSTDVIGNLHSLVFDSKAAMPGKGRMFKTLVWYHNTLSLAARIVDLVHIYTKLDQKEGNKS